MPKPGRPGDFVAQPHPTINRKRRKISLSGFMKGKDATISRRSLKEIEDIHNAPIRFLLESLKREGKYPQQGLFSLTDLTVASNLSLCSVLPAALSGKGLSFSGIL